MFLLIGAPLMLVGAPSTPLLLGLPRFARRRVVRPLAASRLAHAVYRGLTYPPFSIGQLVLLLFAWHLIPGWYDAALRNDAVHDLEHFSFLAGGFIFWWPVIDPAPLRSRLGYGQRMLYLPPMMATRIMLGAFLTFADRPFYDSYLDVNRLLPLTPLEDQQLGGLLMWLVGVMMHLVAVGIIFVVWVRKSERADEPPLGAVLPDEVLGDAGD